MPSRGSLERRIAGLGPLRSASAREGREAARALSSAGGEAPPVTCVLEQVQTDHTVVDVIVVDEVHRLSIGRPYVTADVGRPSIDPAAPPGQHARNRQVRLAADVDHQLQAVAERQQRTPSAVLRDAVSDYIAAHAVGQARVGWLPPHPPRLHQSAVSDEAACSFDRAERRDDVDTPDPRQRADAGGDEAVQIQLRAADDARDE